MRSRAGTDAEWCDGAAGRAFEAAAWLIAPSPDHAVCQGLAFSYGVHPLENANEDSDWRDFIERWLRQTT